MPFIYSEGEGKKPVINKLPIATGATFDSHAEEHNRICLPNTRVEDPDAKAVFWLNGMAGTGKSTILRTVAGSSFDRDQLGASFFFKRGKGDRVYVKNTIDANHAIYNKAIREQFEKLVLNPLTEITSLRNRKSHILIIVINTLDNRPELLIRFGFYNVKGTYQDLHDLSVYFIHELAKIRNEYNKSALDLRILITIAILLFIFATTACRFLVDQSKFDATYRPVLDQLIVDLSDRAKSEALILFKRFVGLIILLANP
ncbi:hypothetical protein F4808DRAFT_453853 [Astrocystis sublimbata]|nr:hypothetical protein F4808DRAFT_453853 [Astrocystis sublimbata]